MIELKTYNRSTLEEFINSPEFSALPYLPISYHRAVSHIRNPRADRNDVLLILAYDHSEMVGYLGVLADWIFDENNHQSKCGWLSCMWINPLSRGKGISKKLVAKALETWDKKILVTEFTAPAKGLYDKTGAFKDLQIKYGIRLYIRSDLARLLPPKSAFLKRIKPLWQFTDFLLNLILDFRFYFSPKKKNSHWKQVYEVDDKIDHFIRQKQSGQIFKRGKNELNWILKFPWIRSAKADSQSRKYYFSSVAGIFEFKALTMEDHDGNIKGFIILARRDNSLKVPYCYFAEDTLDQVISCLTWHILEWKIKTVTIFHPDLVRHFEQKQFPAFFTKSFKRHYIISRVFDAFEHDTRYEIQDGDADCAFT